MNERITSTRIPTTTTASSAEEQNQGEPSRSAPPNGPPRDSTCEDQESSSHLWSQHFHQRPQTPSSSQSDPKTSRVSLESFLADRAHRNIVRRSPPLVRADSMISTGMFWAARRLKKYMSRVV